MKRKNKRKSVIIFGASGHAKVCADILGLNGYEVLCFTEQGTPKKGARLLNIPVMSEDDPRTMSSLKRGESEYFVGIGDNAIRRKVIERLKLHTGKEPVNAIHPAAVVSKFAKIGCGNFINCGVKINADARIGNYTIVNTSATVDHDCIVNDYTQIGPGVNLASNVLIEEMAFLGTNAAVIPKVKIGAYSIIGAGAVVIRDVPPRVTAVGVPAKVIKRH